MTTTILVTGGAGYIGSHTAVELANRGAHVVIADNFANSSPRAVDAVRELATGTVDLVEVDLTDRSATAALFSDHDIDGVVHFAGLKAVGESMADPARYYDTNLGSALSVLDAMATHQVYDFVFSSSATVYAETEELPMVESSPLGPTNPYGRTKLMIEQICRDLAASDDRWRMTMLRYFNPVGAHESGQLGEDPTGVPNNLVPFVMQVAVGRRDEVKVFGDDYDTADGTGVRDYVHVCDLAVGHVAAIDSPSPGWRVFNLGTGVGASVHDVIAAATEVSGVEIPHRTVDRRPGDIAASVADPSLAEQELGWRAERGLTDMIRDAWRWQSAHPNGFAGDR